MKIPVAALPETRAWILASTTLLVLCSLASPALTEAENPWGGYLDYAYVYSSAQPEALRGRLDEYGAQAGMTLEAYVTQEFEARRDLDEHALRRKAIAYLLVYLASGDSNPLDISVASVRDLEAHLGRHENRYWYHYILAHEALEARDPGDFVANVLELWLHVVTPLEAPYETLRTLSLSHSASAGFASALPYVFENLTRLILIRTQEMRLDRGLDALGAVVRMLHDGRVGQHPDVIPREASSFGYLDRIVRRLNGPESDSGSLTFTLALFEARKVHDRARSLLATEGLSPDGMEVFHVATGAYQDALERARTVQGHTAVFTRGLRQLGEMYAARQRFGVDRDVETLFTISKALQVYATMYEVPEGGWERLGYRSSGREGYLDGMRRLWQEIQEASLNASAYHLSRSLEAPHRAPQHVRSAANIYARYLDFFERYATGERREAVPDSAYFAAYDAARGYGDAFLAYPSAASTTTELDLATRRYVQALRIFPFDHELWPAVRAALDRRGRANNYLELVQPIADATARSRVLDVWIQNNEPESTRLRVMRRALADGLAVMYLGYAEGSGLTDLETSLEELRTRNELLVERVALLTATRARLSGDALPAAPATPADDSGWTPPTNLHDVARELSETSGALTRLERQIEARTRSLPLYKAVLEESDLARELAAQRNHPVHELLRRLYYESES